MKVELKVNGKQYNVEMSEEELCKYIPKSNKPILYEDYYYLDSCGTIIESNWACDNGDEARYAIDNVFKTINEANKHLKWLEARKILKDAFEKANDGWVPDFNNSNELKYTMRYDSSRSNFEVGTWCTVQAHEIWEYIKSDKLAKEFICKYATEWKIYKGIDK